MPDVPEDAVDAAMAGGDEWVRRSRSVVFTSPARDQVRAMLEAAAPLIAAASEAKFARELREILDRHKSGSEGEPGNA